MDSRTLFLVIAVVAILFIAAAVLIKRRSKGERLKQRFGAEYDRVVQQRGDLKTAEAELAERERRVQAFSIRALSSADRDAYAIEWSNVQRRFVDDPSGAVLSADRLVDRVMTDRGYPMTDFEQRSADISVSFPGVVENYRSAHDIALRQGSGTATTEELRRAMVHYRSLFDELLETRTVQKTDNSNLGVTHERAS